MLLLAGGGCGVKAYVHVQGERGVLNYEVWAYVLYGWPLEISLTKFTILNDEDVIDKYNFLKKH